LSLSRFEIKWKSWKTSADNSSLDIVADCFKLRPLTSARIPNYSYPVTVVYGLAYPVQLWSSTYSRKKNCGATFCP